MSETASTVGKVAFKDMKWRCLANYEFGDYILQSVHDYSRISKLRLRKLISMRVGFSSRIERCKSTVELPRVIKVEGQIRVLFVIAAVLHIEKTDV